MDLAKMQQEEVVTRMAMVRGFRDKSLTEEQKSRLEQQHAYAKTRVQIARALLAGPTLTSKQKREIASML